MTSTTSISTNHTTTSPTNPTNPASNSACFQLRRTNNAKPTVSQKSQYWCLCVPNYTETEYQDIASLVEKQLADFVIIGKEICPKTQTPHFHAYIQFKTRKLTSQVWRLSAGHWETCKGSAQDNILYCSKQNNYQTYGQPNAKQGSKEYTHQGYTKEKRNEQLRQKIEECINVKTFAQKYPSEFAKNCNGIAQLFRFFREEQQITKIDFPKFVIYLAGSTGCGKTKLAYNLAMKYTNNTQRPFKNTLGTLTYFDNFEHQKVAIFDELRKTSCPFTFLLNLLDRYPLDVQQKAIKGGIDWDPEVIIITSPRIPQEEFKFQKKITTEDGRLKISTEIYEDVEQLVRRCDVIIEFAQNSTVANPIYTFHKGEQQFQDFVNKITPPQPEQTNESIDFSMPRYPTDEE